MKEETLARAKELEEDIRDIRMAMTERSNARHFAMLEHYGYDARRNNLPKWLTPKIMEVLGEERERLEHELENLTDDNSEPTDFELTGNYNVEPHDDEVSEQEITKKKRPKVLSMFYALLMCMFYLALSIGVNILSHKLFGLYCGLDSITFSMVLAIVWTLCYLSITED